MRIITASLIASLFTVAAIYGSAATASADSCSAHQEPNAAAPEFYQEQYNPSVAKPLTKDLATYHAAVGSGDVEQIGQAAGTLYSEISTNVKMSDNPTLFGCYTPAVLASLQQATSTLAPAYDNIASAAASIGGKHPGDVPGLISEAKPLEKAYIQVLNAYASQFGGQQVPQS